MHRKDHMTTTPNAESVTHAHTPAPAAVPGEIVLARYRLGRRLGAGGMGVVFQARDEHLEREVAVKRIAVEHDRDGRGEREAIAAARLSHPGIVALYESGRDDRRCTSSPSSSAGARSRSSCARASCRTATCCASA